MGVYEYLLLKQKFPGVDTAPCYMNLTWVIPPTFAQNNYLAAAIVGGELQVVADSGGDRVELRSNNNNYNDGEIHTVIINKNIKK